MDPITLNIVLGALLGASELLSMIPQIRANSIFQLATQMIARLLRPEAPEKPVTKPAGEAKK